MVKTVFDLYRGRQKFGLSSVFAFRQAKEQILFQVQPLKIWNTTFLCAHYRVTVQIFWGPATSENATLTLLYMAVWLY